MTKRITITLPDTVYSELKAWAESRGQVVAAAASTAVELLLRDERDRVSTDKEKE